MLDFVTEGSPQRPSGARAPGRKKMAGCAAGRRCRSTVGRVREAFTRHGTTYRDATTRASGESVVLDKSSAYLESEPLFAQDTSKFWIILRLFANFACESPAPSPVARIGSTTSEGSMTIARTRWRSPRRRSA